jgi:plasmid maintenance system antidote protein VapI
MKDRELRGEMAKHNLHAYKVAAEADINPVTLSQLLHGRRLLTDEVADRISRAIAKLGRRGQRRGK